MTLSVYKRQWKTKQGTARAVWMVQVVWTHPDGSRTTIRKRSPIQTKRGAEQYERDLRTSLCDGSYGKERPKRVVPTVAQFAEEFMHNYAKVNNKHSTYQDKQSIFTHHLLPFFGSMKLDKVGAREIESFRAHKLQTHSAKTVTNQLSVLRKMLNVAVDWELLDNVPKFRWSKLPESTFRFLDFEEADRLLGAARDDPETMWFVMVFLALNTGMRQGELLALRWSDVDLHAGRLSVRQSVTRGVVGTPKSGKGREIPLNGPTLETLKGHRHLRGPLVFCNEDGSMLTKNQCRCPLRRLQQRAGLSELGWHDLRHTFASHLAMRGASMKAIQELLGHSTMKMTLRYAHLTPTVRRDTVELLAATPPRYIRGTRSGQK